MTSTKTKAKVSVNSGPPPMTGGGVHGGSRKRQKMSGGAELLHVARLDQLSANMILRRLSRLTGPVATTLYARIVRAWTRRRSRRVSITLSPAELALLQELGSDTLRLDVVRCPLWTVTYRNDELDKEVVVRTVKKPTRRRRFRVPGKGKPQFEAIAAKRTRTTTPEEERMAKRKKNTKAAEAEADVDDEIEGIEEDLDDLDDLDEPEAEVEEDEDDEPAPKRKRSKKSTASKRKRKAAVADEDDEDEDDEEETPKKRQKKGAKKGGKKSSGSKKGQAPPTRELPKGRFGASEIADLAGTDGRTVRQFLRRHADEFPKDEELGRYSFTKKEATSIAKKIKANQD